MVVATDKSRNEHLTFVSLPELTRVFRTLSNDKVAVAVVRRDRHGRMHVTAK